MNDLFWIFHIQMEYRQQSMYHMVGRTVSVVSPFYSLLPDSNLKGYPQRWNFKDDFTENM